MSDVFLSYAREDRAPAARLAEALKAEGWDVWWDPHVRTGLAFDDVIKEALDATRCVVVLWSPHSVKSDWVKEEAEFGKQKDALLPARIADVQLPMGFRRRQTADLRDWKGGSDHPGMRDLLRDLRVVLGEPTAARAGTSGSDAVSSPLASVIEAAPEVSSGADDAGIAQPGPSVGTRWRPRPLGIAGLGLAVVALALLWIEGSRDAKPPVAGASVGNADAEGTHQPEDPTPPIAGPSMVSADGKGTHEPPNATTPRESFAETALRPAMMRIPAGSFDRGSAPSEAGRYNHEGPQRRVTLAQPFLMARTEVTQAQFASVMKTKPAAHAACDRCPVENVTWLDAVKYCNALSDQDKLSACYAVHESDADLDPRCTGYRLPTEAEWEYAARAGTTAPYLDGGSEKKLERFAWHAGNSGGQTHPVGEKAANAWGLHDVLGNVWEWVEDDWHDSYEGAPTEGSAWVDRPQRAAYRVLRGGSWLSAARYCRVAYRRRWPPGLRSVARGFRVARSWPSTL